MYQRNFLYIKEQEQKKIAQTRILLGGAGLGSVIAEAALRIGFKHLMIIDGDHVEASNLNRQNYTRSDIGKPKVTALKERLLSIDPTAVIECHEVFLNENNLQQYIAQCDIAINAIDFASDAPFVFDRWCREYQIPVIHPYNFGWAGCVYVLKPDTTPLQEIAKTYKNFELELADHTLHFLKEKTNLDLEWIFNFKEQYQQHLDVSPSQLSVGSFVVAGMVTNLLFSLANDLPVRTFPEPYFLSTRG